MEMTGERLIPASRAKVWAALNDPAILQAAIPGCTAMELTGPDSYKASASVKLGPIAAKFSGNVRLLDLQPPESYRIEGSGQGGPAGHASGGAKVVLIETGAHTKLSYEVTAQVGGKLAQLGARLIDASAKQMADQFFDRFAALLTDIPDPALAAPEPEAAPQKRALPPIAWVAFALYAAIFFLLFV